MKFNIFTKSFLWIFFLVLFVYSDTLMAKDQSKLQPGTYILGRGSGELSIRSDEQDKMTFRIVSVGANCHMCDVSGVILGSTGYADVLWMDDNESKCKIFFNTNNNSTINVEPLTYDECRGFCGARAGFDGLYRKPPAKCTDQGRKQQQEQFLRLYKSHHYAKAEKILQNQLKQCSNFINWIEIDEVRNDLALAQYHNGEYQQCLDTLNTTLVANVNDEDELKEGKDGFYLPPCDYDNYIHVAKSTWFNKALCSKALKNRQKEIVK